MGDVCIEYLLADLASTFVGAIPCGDLPDEFTGRSWLCAAACPARRIFIAEDQEHLDRLLDAEAKENAPLVDKIIVCDERALFLYDDPRIEPFGSVISRGNTDPAAQSKVIEFEKTVKPDDVSAIIFTSGTTGFPKAAYRTQSSDVIGFGYSFIETFPEMRARPHRIVCQLPLAHGMGRAIAIYGPLIADIIPHIGEPNQNLVSSDERDQADLRDGSAADLGKNRRACPSRGRQCGLSCAHAHSRLATARRPQTRPAHLGSTVSAPWYLEATYWPALADRPVAGPAQARPDLCHRSMLGGRAVASRGS